MPQSKQRHAEYMREQRGSQKGSQGEGSQPEGSQGILAKGYAGVKDIEYIKSQLSPGIVNDIGRIIRWYERLGTGIPSGERWYNAYKYHIWDTSGRPLPANLLEVTQ